MNPSGPTLSSWPISSLPGRYTGIAAIGFSKTPMRLGLYTRLYTDQLLKRQDSSDGGERCLEDCWSGWVFSW
jgi:hypothetical protein